MRRRLTGGGREEYESSEKSIAKQSARLVLVNLTSSAPVYTTELPLGQLYLGKS